MHPKDTLTLLSDIFSLTHIHHAHSDLIQVKFVFQQTPQCLCMYQPSRIGFQLPINDILDAAIG